MIDHATEDKFDTASLRQREELGKGDFYERARRKRIAHSPPA